MMASSSKLFNLEEPAMTREREHENVSVCGSDMDDQREFGGFHSAAVGVAYGEHD